MKVKVTEYKGHVVVETLKPEADEDFIPVTEPGKIGSVLINTGKHLGISKEALAIMKGYKVSMDDIGEVDAWKTDDGKDCFAWLGPLDRPFSAQSELSRNGWADIDYIDIPNETSQWIRKEMDAAVTGR